MRPSRRGAPASTTSPSLCQTAAIDAWAARLDELGIAHDPIDDQGFAVGLNVRDPDGIALEFYYLVRK